jgi:hypothetical protein
MSKAVRDEVDRLRAAAREPIRRAKKITDELRCLQDEIAESLKQVGAGRSRS